MAAPRIQFGGEAIEMGIGRERYRPQLHRLATATSEIPRPWYAKFWRRNISVNVPHAACRDHLANERTALSYIRTAQAFAVMGVTIGQLMRLDTGDNPNREFGYLRISIPLSATCHCVAITFTCLGCLRFFHWQNEMARGNGISSGWELLSAFGLTLTVLICVFVLMLVVAIIKLD